MVSESFKTTRKEGKQSNKHSRVTKKKKTKVVHMQLETQSRDSEAVCIQSKLQARD